MDNNLPKQGTIRQQVANILVDGEDSVINCIEGALSQQGYSIDVKTRFDLLKCPYGSPPVEYAIYRVK